MSDVRPFRALRFSGELGPRLAGPYDVISDEERAALATEPENIVHLTLPPGPEGERDYGSAGETLARWISAGVLVRDSVDQLYVLEERTVDGRVRRGFLALLRLADYDEGVVLPHEHTMPGPKVDRLRLTRAVRANLEPLFFLYEDRDGKLDASLDRGQGSELLASAPGPDGTGLSLYALADRGAIGTVQAFLADLPVIIADGHHRYETMLEYRGECRRAGATGNGDGAEFVLAYLVNAFDPGSQIRSIHRVLRGAVAPLAPTLEAAGFRQTALADGIGGEALVSELHTRLESEHAFVFVDRELGAVLATRARGERLDVEVLHDELLPALGGELAFDSRPDRLVEAVQSGDVALGVLLNPVDADSLFRAIQAGTRLPKKSTFFTPKIPSGLLVRDF